MKTLNNLTASPTVDVTSQRQKRLLLNAITLCELMEKKYIFFKIIIIIRDVDPVFWKSGHNLTSDLLFSCCFLVTKLLENVKSAGFICYVAIFENYFSITPMVRPNSIFIVWISHTVHQYLCRSATLTVITS